MNCKSMRPFGWIFILAAILVSTSLATDSVEIVELTRFYPFIKKGRFAEYRINSQDRGYVGFARIYEANFYKKFNISVIGSVSGISDVIELELDAHGVRENSSLVARFIADNYDYGKYMLDGHSVAEYKMMGPEVTEQTIEFLKKNAVDPQLVFDESTWTLAFRGIDEKERWLISYVIKGSISPFKILHVEMNAEVIPDSIQIFLHKG